MRVGTPHVSFSQPPVAEVVCGVQFSPSENVFSAHIAQFWSKIQDEFPRTQDVPPLPPSFEGPRPAPRERVYIQTSDDPASPRMWFFDITETHLIQMQRDRFLMNWRKADDSYPRFENVYQQFKSRFEQFENFCLGELSVSLQPKQYDLTYVNMIDPESGVEFNDYQRVFVDHRRGEKKDRFLHLPESFNWRDVYPLPDGAGRLYISASSMTKKGDESQKGIRLELHANGFPAQGAGMDDWFLIAHEYVTRGFVDVTDGTVQEKAWGRH